jgi:hypothetical protein
MISDSPQHASAGASCLRLWHMSEQPTRQQVSTCQRRGFVPATQTRASSAARAARPQHASAGASCLRLVNLRERAPPPAASTCQRRGFVPATGVASAATSACAAGSNATLGAERDRRRCDWSADGCASTASARAGIRRCGGRALAASRSSVGFPETSPSTPRRPAELHALKTRKPPTLTHRRSPEPAS